MTRNMNKTAQQIKSLEEQIQDLTRRVHILEFLVKKPVPNAKGAHAKTYENWLRVHIFYRNGVSKSGIAQLLHITPYMCNVYLKTTELEASRFAREENLVLHRTKKHER